MITLLIIALFLGALCHLLKHLNFERFGLLSDENKVSKVLLVWIILGFYFRLDFTEQWGCFFDDEPVWAIDNIVFSSISFLAILMLLFSKNIQIKKSIVVLEFLYWWGKLVFFKGGYAIGIAGVPDLFIVFYDLIAAALRCLLFLYLWKIQDWNLNKIGLAAILTIGLKLLYIELPLPWEFIINIGCVAAIFMFIRFVLSFNQS